LNPIVLHLKHAPGPLREAAAWFIAGSNPAAWVEEICRWQVPQDKLRLWILPRSMADRGAAGVFVLLPAGLSPRCQPRGLPFGAIAQKLFLPVDSLLWPPVEPRELNPLSELLVFHPGIGLVGFEPKDGLTVADLLRQPPSRVENWNFARPGVALNPRLRSVELIAPLDPNQLFGDAPKEIGTDPVTDLPPAPGEPGRTMLGRTVSRIDRLLAGGLAALLRGLPHTAPHRTWVNKLEDWAAARAAGLAKAFEDLRHKELNRLLRQLENDPEQGLRFAIPLSQLAHRGLAPPGNRLTPRNPNFDLGHLRGGGAADFWSLPADLQLQLRNKYRELANRELRLGRFRRAAYIHAELLGDLEAAASVLKQGKHFREAAVVYKDHLRRPREAAQCLAEGGLITEAIALYEAEQCFIEIGNLYLQVGQLEQAQEAFEKEVQRQLAAGNRIGAAQFLETKLEAPERAWEILAQGWPNSTQATKCLEAQFEWLARYSNHSRAADLLKLLRNTSVRRDLVVQMSQILTHQARQYPDRAVRLAAADLVRVKAGEHFDIANQIETGQLSEAIARLAPEDKLLARDASRFSSLRRDELRRIRPTPAPRKILGPFQIRTFRLPNWISWQAMKSCGPYFFAAGMTESKFFLLRGRWDGMVQTLSWPQQLPGLRPFLMEFDQTATNPSQLLVAPGPTRPLLRLPEKAFPAADDFPGVLPAGTPDFLPDDLIAVSIQDDFLWLLRDRDDGLLECRRRSGNLISTIEISDCLAKPTDFSSVLLAQRDLTWIASGQTLSLLRERQPGQSWKAENGILSLVASPPHLPQAVLACLNRGVAIHWVGHLEERVETLCADLVDPLAAFTADGNLVLLGEGEGRICSLNARTLEGIAPFRWPGGKALALVRADGPNQFAIFAQDGQVTLFKLTEG
jgi:tetratricopeptide (TPR) repeat protein